MNQSNRHDKQSLYSSVKAEIKNADFSQELKHDLDESIAYYLNPRQREQLVRMGFFKKALFLIWWFTKGIFSKLNPVRRILFVAALVLLLSNVDNFTGTKILGGFILTFLLLLELKEKLFAKDELKDGHAVQKALMPVREPAVSGWSCWLYSEPANDVGGDLVDYIAISENCHGLSLGDVSGKGLGAALYMAKLQATIRALVPEKFRLSLLAEKINRIFNRDCEAKSFASLIFLEVSSSSDTIHYFNAGHFPPLLVRSGKVQTLAKGGPALGLTPRSTFEELDFKCEKGDWVLLYSDGITEAFNETGEFFGEQRLISFLERVDGKDSRVIGEALLAEIKLFQGPVKPYDDISLIVMKRIDI